MKPVEEIARGLRDTTIAKLLDMTRQECCGHGVGGDISSPPECCGTPYNLWQDSNAENALTVVAKAFDEAVAAALRAERERAEKAEYELNRWKEVRANAPDWEKLWAEQSDRAEKAEADKDEVLWDARFQIDAQVKSREAAEARAEKAEAERDEAREMNAIFRKNGGKAYATANRLRDRALTAETALATARNRALEEAAQARPVTPHGSPKSWEQGYADGTSEFADAILALRTKEGE